MPPDEIERIGEALGSKWWQADLAKKCGYSKSSITRFTTRDPGQSRTVPPAFVHALREEMLRKIEALAALLTIPSLPGSEMERTVKMQQTILQAVNLLRDAR
jgi:hypothetical protein